MINEVVSSSGRLVGFRVVVVVVGKRRGEGGA